MSYLGVGPNVNLAAPGPIGGSSPDTGKFTDVTSTRPGVSYMNVDNISGGGWKAGYQFKAMYSAMTAKGVENYIHAQEKKLLIANAISVDEVEAITW